MAEPAIIRLIRETLEQRLKPSDAAAAVVDALSAWNATIPNDFHATLEFLRGPVRDELLARLPRAEITPLLRQIEQVLLASEIPTGKRESLPDADARAIFPEEDRRTESIPEVGGPVQIVVFSMSGGFAQHLTEATEPGELKVETAHTLELLATKQYANIVLVDCGLAPDVPTEQLASVLGLFSANCWRVVWGSDIEAGRRLVELLDEAGVHNVPLPVRSGLAPLLDLVRARASE